MTGSLRRLVKGAFLATLVLALTAPVVGAQPRSGGELTVGMAQEILDLDPHTATAFSSLQVLGLIYEGLVLQDPATLDVVPGLASTWDVSDDGTVYTFNLREARFHDGSPVTAQDVKYSFERILDPATASPQASQLPALRSIDILSPTQVRFVLEEPFAPFLDLLAGTGRAIVPVGFVEKVGTPRTVTLGTGPFRMESFGADRVRLVKFDGYWGRDASGTQLPYLDEVIIQVVPDANTLRSALRTGDVDVAAGFGLDAVAAVILRRDANLVVEAVPDLSYTLMGLNTQRPPLDDVRVRQALSLAVDRQEIVDVVYSGEAVVAGPIPPTLEAWRSHDESELPYYTPTNRAAEVQALLREAGVTDLSIKLLPIPTVPDAVQAAQVIQAQLERVGIGSEIEQVDFATFLDRWGSSDFDAFVSLNGGSTDPDLHLYRHLHSTGSTNVFLFQDPESDRLLEAGRTTPSQEERRAIYAELELRLAEQVPTLWIAYPRVYGAWQSDVQGFVLSSTRTLRSLAETWLDE